MTRALTSGRGRSNTRWSLREGNGTGLTDLSVFPLTSRSRLLTITSLQIKWTSWYMALIGQTPWTGNRVGRAKCRSKRVNEGIRWRVNKRRNNRERAKREKAINFRIRKKKSLTRFKGQNSVEWESCPGWLTVKSGYWTKRKGIQWKGERKVDRERKLTV